MSGIIPWAQKFFSLQSQVHIGFSTKNPTTFYLTETILSVQARQSFITFLQLSELTIA